MNDDLQHRIITLTDGQQVLVAESQSIRVDEIGISSMIGNGPSVGIKSRQDIVASPEEYKHLLKEAMTKFIEVDTITGKAQALMKTEKPNPKPANSVPEAIVVPNPKKDIK